MPSLGRIVAVAMDMKSKSARYALRANLRSLMAEHPTLKNRRAVGQKAGVAPRTVGYMLEVSGPSPTLEKLEAVAAAFGLRAWELLVDPDEDQKRILYRIFRQPPAA